MGRGDELRARGRGWGPVGGGHSGPRHTCRKGRDGLRGPSRLRPPRWSADQEDSFDRCSDKAQRLSPQSGDVESGLGLLFTSGRDTHILIGLPITLLQAEAQNPAGPGTRCSPAAPRAPLSPAQLRWRESGQGP